ncbi:hypothetical protein [Marinifilum breve]|nr:hypothetical protein [Marinifilum breve]
MKHKHHLPGELNIVPIENEKKMKLITYEVFTKEYSRIVEATGVLNCIEKFNETLDEGEEAQIIAMIDTKEGTEFLQENKVPGVCSICGCTDNRACADPEKGNCSWVDVDRMLCTHCLDKLKAKAAAYDEIDLKSGNSMDVMDLEEFGLWVMEKLGYE